MKLASRLESQLTKLFLISAGVGAVVLFTSIYISTTEIKSKAVSFISSHVKSISFAEINSQNVSDIDREVRRLYEAWRGTQDIDIRIEVFLDEKLVGKAGQLQRFGFLSYATSETHNLPSGQKLDIKIQLDLINQIITDLIMLAVFSLFLFGCYYLLRRNLGKTIQQVTTPLERRVEWLTYVAQRLPESIRGERLTEDTSIDEVSALDVSLNAFAEQILLLEDRVKEAGIKEGRVRMAEQLAHTVKGKLSLLQLRINNSGSLSDSEKERLSSAVSDVASATQILLKSGRANQSNLNSGLNELSELDLVELLVAVVAQKKETVSDSKKVELQFVRPESARSVVYGSRTHLEATFSNIIDNAIEAVDSTGTIKVELMQESGFSRISISDNGCGIPEDIVPQLMKERATFGKQDGNGLGLFHAKLTVEQLGGTIRLTSVLGKGTEVAVSVPSKIVAINKPESLEIDLSEVETLVVLDDDKCIHSSIELMLGKNTPFRVTHLFSIPEFELWMSENGAGELGSRLYWMDYDLKHPSETGAKMIQKYGLQFESYLVTGMADSDEVKALTKEHNIRLLAKGDIEKIRFKFNENIRLPEIGLG